MHAQRTSALLDHLDAVAESERERDRERERESESERERSACQSRSLGEGASGRFRIQLPALNFQKVAQVAVRRALRVRIPIVTW